MERDNFINHCNDFKPFNDTSVAITDDRDAKEYAECSNSQGTHLNAFNIADIVTRDFEASVSIVGTTSSGVQRDYDNFAIVAINGVMYPRTVAMEHLLSLPLFNKITNPATVTDH